MASPPTRKETFKEPAIEQILRPFQEFARVEASSGLILIFITAIALIWANSPWGDSYFSLWKTYLIVDIGGFGVKASLLHWINDGLMAVFFFVVGLEIKREVLVGELSSPRQALLPIAAAVGGMVVPALLYVALNAGGAGMDGWGIPMATDIAFALGVMALLGKRIPLSLKIFLTALAIVDDLGAVLVIAIFYTESIIWSWIAIGAIFLLAMILANWLGVRHPVIYGALGIGLWFALLESGVHATIAGVLGAMTIPAQARINTREFVAWTQGALDEIVKACRRDGSQESTVGQRSMLQALEKAVQHAEAPLQRLEHSLEYPVAFTIMPIFALANAGVSLGGDLGSSLFNPVSLGIILGLIVGKQVGITLFAWLAVRSGLATLPAGVNWKLIYGASWLGGIGFTMSLFISGLAFEDEALLATAKVGILAASIIAGLIGWFLLSRFTAGESHPVQSSGH